ncbi:ABC transporter ATP-binding protein [Aestuariimicrobium soli]|uniref:ABC transporter ATP-binding protein n=1 Tax=Aestuariimicrobium soli TaxID=2035834 RepID=UPI003EBE4254
MRHNYPAAALLWLRTSFAAAQWLVAVMLLTTVAGSVLAPLSLWGVSHTIDAATRQTSLWPGLLVTGGCLLVSAVASGLAGPIGDTVDDRLFRHVNHDLSRVVGSIPSLAHHENPEIADRLALVKQDAWRLGGIYRLLQTIGAVASVVTVVGLLWSIHPLLLLVLVAALVPTGVSALGRTKEVEVNRRNIKFWRAAEMLVELLTKAQHGLEVRSFGLRTPLLRTIRRGVMALNAPITSTASRWSVYAGLAWIAQGGVHLAALVWLAGRAAEGQATIGQVTLLLLIGPQISTTAAAVSANARQVIESLAAFDRYRWLRDYSREHQWDDGTAAPPDQLRTGIRLEGVSFSYPGADGPTTALAGVDLTIPAGTSVALVGRNGAGKSTLVKLLSRFYDPTTGRILVDGVPLTDLDPREWRKRMSAGFQDFSRLTFLVRESIGVGDIARVGDDERVRTAASAGHADSVIAQLEAGLDTQLGTDFEGGVDLSGGQWQRLALARAFMRERPLLMILDEPTAALDPEAEHTIYDQYAATAKRLAAETGAITVLVSHRFSTVRMADLIVVMDDGRVAEVGTHAELLAADGDYARMFRLQADAYR